MRRSATVKFPNSAQLFNFCRKVMMDQRGMRVHDQEVGSILDFNPSDCSHWKRGEKNVKSVFALARLADALKVDTSLIHDVASGNVGIDEAYFEFQEAKGFLQTLAQIGELPREKVQECRNRVESFVNRFHAQADFKSAPLYLPEILRFFPYVTAQGAEMMDKLSRILRIKPGQYTIQYKKGDLSAQTRMAITKDLARIIFDGERQRYEELGETDPSLAEFEKLVFASVMLIPRTLLISELAKLDARSNVIAELGALFWAPKALVSFQLQDMLRHETGLGSDAMLGREQRLR